MLISIYSICGCTDNNEDIKDKYGWSEKEIIILAEEIIKDEFLIPSSTFFYNISVELTKENLNNNEYKISGNVNSENDFGKKIKSSFYIYLECSSNNEYQIGDWDIYV